MRNPKLLFVLRGDVRRSQARLDQIFAWYEQFVQILQSRGRGVQIFTSRPATSLFSPRAWERTVATVRRGKTEGICVGLASGGPYKGSDECEAWFDKSAFRAQKDVVELRLSATFGGTDVLTEVEYVTQCLSLIEASGLPQGLLLPSRMPLTAFETPFETRASLARVSFGPNALDRYIRGPGWGLWLTGKLLDGLGGRERVARDAPVHRVVERAEGLWLELTSSPWDVPTDRLAQLEAYLAPILPTIEQIRTADPQFTERPAESPLSPADDYADYRGPAVPVHILAIDDTDLPLHLSLAALPSAEASDALERAVRAWYSAGADGTLAGGGFHGIISGPSWGGNVVRWTVDIGFANPQEALRDLARRLGGWSTRWGAGITVLRVGVEEI